jgi:hypothetical protein
MRGQTSFASENLLKGGIRRYQGKFRGIVTRTDDPLFQGRIQARVPSVLGEYDCNWALPCVPFAGDIHGFQFLPEPGDGVWIEFEQGDPNKPIWVGFWWKSNTLPVEKVGAYDSRRRFLWVPGNMYIEFNSIMGEELIKIKHHTDAEIRIDPSGHMQLKSPVRIDIDAPYIGMAGDGPNIARVGDTVICPAGVGHITSGSEKAGCGG